MIKVGLDNSKFYQFKFELFMSLQFSLEKRSTRLWLGPTQVI